MILNLNELDDHLKTKIAFGYDLVCENMMIYRCRLHSNTNCYSVESRYEILITLKNHVAFCILLS